MLTRIEIDGFKSFTNFAMDFSPLTVIAGLNASGKSNLFDALHLLSLLAEHDLNTAFDKVQRGRNIELFTQYADGRVAEEMRFAVEVQIEPTVNDDVGRLLKLSFKRFRYELSIRRTQSDKDTPVLRVDDESFAPAGFDAAQLAKAYLKGYPPKIGLASHPSPAPFVYTVRNGEPNSKLIVDDTLILNHSLARMHDLRFDKAVRAETALGVVGANKDTAHLFAVQQELRSWKLLHLDPAKIPNPSSAQAFGLPGQLNASADNLAAVLWRIEKTDPYLLSRITQRLASLVPGIKEIVVKHDDYYNQYRVFIHTTAGQRFPLHLLSEGTLRMLALCTLVFDPEQKGLVGLEEVENGVHPARLKDIARLLRDLSTDPADPDPGPLRQVIVNTHSPGLVKACLEAVTGEEGRASGLTVWFSQLVSRPVEEDGKRVMRRVTDMLPVILPNGEASPPAATVEGLDRSQRKLALYQLIKYLESPDAGDLFEKLNLPKS